MYKWNLKLSTACCRLFFTVSVFPLAQFSSYSELYERPFGSCSCSLISEKSSRRDHVELILYNRVSLDFILASKNHWMVEVSKRLEDTLNVGALAWCFVLSVLIKFLLSHFVIIFQLFIVSDVIAWYCPSFCFLYLMEQPKIQLNSTNLSKLSPWWTLIVIVTVLR